MKLILFLVAIYSLIIHQSRKNGRETELPGKQKTITQKLINQHPPLTDKIYPHQFAIPSDSIQRLGFGSSIQTGVYAKRGEKGQQYLSLMTNPLSRSRQ